jgi:hypothetical protein
MANEYLDLNMMGPLGNGYFAGYNALMRLRATQVRSEVDGEIINDHLNPKITNYSGTLSLFPSRPFPLKIFTGKSEENNIRYESGNRSEIDLVDPGLAVVRRYETINEETGARWRWAVNPDLEVGLEVKKTANQMSRQYDFDENRNIWVDFRTISPGVAPYYNIEVINTIPDRDVLVFVDFALADTVKAGETINLVIEEGMRDLDFVPVGLNAYSQRLNLSSDMQWTIFFSDPPGSKDMDQQNDIVTARVLYGKDKPFQTDAFLEFNDGTEDVQEMVTSLTSFNNLATYDFSPTSNLSSLTTYNSNLTDVGDISHQLSKMFMQQTTGRWRRSRGISTMVSHMYSKMSSDTGIDNVTSTNNILNGKAIMPTNWMGHEVSLNLNGNFLSDSKDYSNNSLFAELENTLAFPLLGFRWKPRHKFKTTTTEGKNPDTSGDELDSKLMVEGENRSLGILGMVRVKGQYDWRRKGDEVGADTKNSYLADLGVTRSFTDRLKLSVGASVNKETFNYEAFDSDASLPQREDEKRKTLRVGAEVSPAQFLNVNFKGDLVRTNKARISKFSIALNMRVPVINLPIRSLYSKERREVDGVLPQELIRLETKASYNFRKIRLLVSHSLMDETLTTEHYVYSEFRAKVSRSFDVF